MGGELTEELCDGFSLQARTRENCPHAIGKSTGNRNNWTEVTGMRWQHSMVKGKVGMSAIMDSRDKAAFRILRHAETYGTGILPSSEIDRYTMKCLLDLYQQEVLVNTSFT